MRERALEPSIPRPGSGNRHRLSLRIDGAVQGVGFRPFFYRLATEVGLVGWVSNNAQGVIAEIEGEPGSLDVFLQRLERERPPNAHIQHVEKAVRDPAGYTSFDIRASEDDGAKTAVVLPDFATCGACVREIFDPGNRRYHYPFTNCTNCGPRFSIVLGLPYDRRNTTMRGFAMCADCQREYEDPRDRRFHAQPNACPRCGPHLELWDAYGKAQAVRDEALRQAAELIRQGVIVAVKGLGGFHLIVDARREDSVRNLRRLKNREEKPFAVMSPSLESARQHCEIGDLEQKLLLSPAAPIVLLRRRASASTAIADSVAPDNPYLGVMLPYTPLHHLLLAELAFPVVATSGNLAEEPICTDEHEAVGRLSGLVEFFLVHDRPIARHVDDSVVRVIMDRELVLRRARGYAPLPVHVGTPGPATLAVGAHLKNALAISLGADVFVSQHIGNLETPQALDAFKEVHDAFHKLYEFRPEVVAHDLHPDYPSTHFALKLGQPRVGVQHHYAHVLACMAENRLDGPVLGISWDGTGYGPDQTVWGGEFLITTANSYVRAAHFRTFALPGGEQAIKQPRRTALGLLYEMFGDEVFSMKHLAPVQAFSEAKLAVLRTMFQRRINAPRTSSAGRLFDAVAALLGLHPEVRFEGQAAMRLEFLVDGYETHDCYDFAILSPDPKLEKAALILDWAPMIRQILDDLERGQEKGRIASRFHNTLAEIIVAVARRLEEKDVVLTGGCFQNKVLTERAVRRLRSENFYPYWHRWVPPNDGGIAVGQVVAAARQYKIET